MGAALYALLGAELRPGAEAMLDLCGFDMLAEGADLSKYADESEISSWAKDAVQWAVALELIKGMPDGTFQPQGMCTRAQVATILMRFLLSYLQ